MIIENVNINRNIDCEGYIVELTGYAATKDEAVDMLEFEGEDIYPESLVEEFMENPPEPLFGGAYYCNCCGELIYIEKVVYSKPHVIVFWSDGTKTRSTCDKEDIWNPELGLTLSVLKKTQGQTFVSKLFRDWSIEISGTELAAEENPKAKTITLKDVRKNIKDFNDASTFVNKIK